MKPLENIKLKVNPDLHGELPTKWKKIGNVLIVDFENLAEDKKRGIAEDRFRIAREKRQNYSGFRRAD